MAATERLSAASLWKAPLLVFAAFLAGQAWLACQSYWSVGMCLWAAAAPLGAGVVMAALIRPGVSGWVRGMRLSGSLALCSLSSLVVFLTLVAPLP